MMAKPSFEPTPRPPLTITFAVVSDTPPVDGATWSDTRTKRSRLSRPATRCLTSMSAGSGPPSIGTVCGATVMRGRALCRSASSSRLPPQRSRATVTGGMGVTATQFAASGRPLRAASRAITSWPRSVPAASTAEACSSSAAPCRIAATASGAKGSTAFICTACIGSPNFRASVSVCREASPGSIRTRTLTTPPPCAAPRPPPAPPWRRCRATRRDGPDRPAPRDSPAQGVGQDA